MAHAPSDGIADAYRWCEQLATSHYENFPVGSVLLPKTMRPHVFAVYAFSRTADDIADEPWTTQAAERLARLDELGALVTAWSAGDTSDGSLLGMALANTMQACSLDVKPFHDLLSAFRQDAAFVRPAAWADVLDYCSRSANPVGRLVLSIAGVTNAEAFRASDDVCTALQLINFWQDLSIDIPRGRHYLPSTHSERDGHAATLLQGLHMARERMLRGAAVVHHVRGRLRWELMLIIAAASRVLTQCESLADSLFEQRPALGKTDYLWATLAVLTGQWQRGLQ
jgi:squalene synthase HpnC